ncbi:MAG: HAD-IIB family hydrolase, partial [Erysipelotrichaceae bacterium]|nr:HAD-IIB family hydrolase [Erysipelotrichaceae bacterium]
RINDFCRKNNLGLFWKMEDCCYIVVDHPNMPKIMEGLPREVVRTEVDDDELPNSGALVGEEKDRQLFMSEFAGQLECVNGGLLLFDVNKLGVSKKNGLEVLLKMLNIDPEDVMAFGDSENDIEMLQMAGTAVVMGDGMEKAKAAADYIAEPTYADGIMKTLKKFGVL